MKNNRPSFPLGKPLLEGRRHFVQLAALCLMMLGCTLVVSALGMLIAGAIYPDGINGGEAGFYRLLQSFSSVGTFLLPALLFAYCHDHRWFSYNAADRIKTTSTAIIGVIVISFLLLSPIGLLVELNKMIHLPKFLSGMEQWMHESQASSDHVLEVITGDHRIGILLLNTVVCALLPALCEEFFFRGTLQQLFQRWSGRKHFAVWFTAFIFSAIHLQFDGFFARWILGAYLGYLMLWSGTLWLPVLAHFLHNTISIILQYIADTHNIEEEIGLTSTSVILSLMAAFLCGVILFYIHRSLRQKNIIETEKDSETDL
ncbi:MAG: CPBP family intramembrane metalloprotease [Bacteroidales bacterium]|nr:CPBP family intramembrane metalloprotease [Bacteroidales bacterium]